MHININVSAERKKEPSSQSSLKYTYLLLTSHLSTVSYKQKRPKRVPRVQTCKVYPCDTMYEIRVTESRARVL